MIQIWYKTMVILITAIWIVVRGVNNYRNRRFDWKRELQLLLVYISLLVVTRFTFCPFSKVDGVIQPLIFDYTNMFPPRINLEPLVHTWDYVIRGEAILNLVGNIAMFIPIGIIWPCVFKELRTPIKGIGAGVGFSLAIEILQLPFYDRVTDIDDLLLNSFGYMIGYGIYLLVKRRKR